jgi:hypothetical protein
MKKYLLVFFIPLLFASCEDVALDDITVRNNLDVAVKVAVTGSDFEPPSSSVRTIEQGESADFPNVDGKGYLHIKSSYSNNEWRYGNLEKKVLVYTIKNWTGNGYEITYLKPRAAK